jgi:hypothetical protein
VVDFGLSLNIVAHQSREAAKQHDAQPRQCLLMRLCLFCVTVWFEKNCAQRWTQSQRIERNRDIQAERPGFAQEQGDLVHRVAFSGPVLLAQEESDRSSHEKEV